MPMERRTVLPRSTRPVGALGESAVPPSMSVEQCPSRIEACGQPILWLAQIGLSYSKRNCL